MRRRCSHRCGAWLRPDEDGVVCTHQKYRHDFTPAQRARGGWHAGDVPTSELAYEIAALIDHYGTIYGVGRAIGLGSGTCHRLAHDPPAVAKETAAKIRKGFARIDAIDLRVSTADLKAFLKRKDISLNSLPMPYRRTIFRDDIAFDRADELLVSLGYSWADVWTADELEEVG